MPEDTTHIRVPAELRMLLRQVAAADGRSMHGVLRRALLEYAIRHDIPLPRGEREENHARVTVRE